MDAGAHDPDELPQGWFVDPFGLHDQRWFSQGTATPLVRDGNHESQDPPPDGVPPGPLLWSYSPSRTDAPAVDTRRVEHRRIDVASDGHVDPGGRPVPPATDGNGGARGRLRLGLATIRPRTGAIPVTPKRMLRMRWVALGFAAVWTLLVTGLLCTASTTTQTGSGYSQSQLLVSKDLAGVVAFVSLLVVADVVTGVGFVRRVRAESEAAGRPGYVFSGILAVLGVLSLASLGLTLVILAAALGVVARPIKKPRPLPGERVV